jgi:peptide/nickel transport system substrate-binding protein
MAQYSRRGACFDEEVEMRREWGVFTATALLGLVLAACGSSGGSKAGGSGGSGGGKPVAGGTLNMLGTGDVDYMDPNISYYTTGYLGLRMWSRQLLTYPATPGQTTGIVPDLATDVPSTSNGGISSDGLTFKLTIRKGAMWNTVPPRQVVAADVVRGLARTCNPAQPFGGLPDFETLIAGFQDYCSKFAKVSPSPAAMKAFMDSNSFAGASVDPSNSLTVVFKLTHPATYFSDQLAMPAFSPAPVEFLNYKPASAALAQHTLSDGPYEISSYIPNKEITFVRNPSWNASTDPVRKAYVNRILVSETGNQQTIQEELQTNTAAADMGWDAASPIAAVPGLLASKDPGLNLGPTYGTSPYVLFNMASPNNHNALANTQVRQALEYAIDRSHLVQDYGGPEVSPPLTHILPPGIVGSQQIDPYPYNPSKAMDMLKTALSGQPSLHLTLLYQSAFDYEVKMFQTLQADLSQVGIKVTGDGVPSADFYVKYLEVPSVAHRGVWDLALANWFPDWYGNGALSFFNPLFSGPPSYPPSGSNFGFYNDPKTNQLIQSAATAPSVSKAAGLWAQADAKVMADAPIFPITSPTQANFRATQVHNAVYVPQLFQFDPTNVWLTPSANGG